jgi:hypothetical protein
MRLLYDLLIEQYSRPCEQHSGPDACGNKEILIETFVNESGLWRLRNVCADCRQQALDHPIGNYLNGLSLPLTTDNLRV